MIRIEYKKTMGFGEFVKRFAIMCPAYIKKEVHQDENCFYVLIEQARHIHDIDMADVGYIISRPGESLLKLEDIKFYEGTLS